MDVDFLIDLKNTEWLNSKFGLAKDSDYSKKETHKEKKIYS